MGTSRPLDTGRRDSIGRTIRVSGNDAGGRADAPPPGTGDSTGDEFANTVFAEFGTDPRWTRRERATQFRLTRLLDRVFTHSRNDIMLKGGMRRLAISPAARYTDDADTYVASDIDDAIDDIISSVQTPLGDDHLQYRHRETRRYDHHPDSAQLFFDVTLNGKPFGTASIDVSTKVRCTQPPMPVTPVHAVTAELDQPDHWPSYATCDQVADKVAAIFEKNPATGAGSRRFHDLVDIELAAMTESVDAAHLREALRVEFEARQLPWPDQFEVPDRATWTSGYRRQTQSVPEMRGRQLGDALDTMHTYLNPVLSDPTFTGRWNPEQQRWVPASG